MPMFWNGKCWVPNCNTPVAQPAVVPATITAPVPTTLAPSSSSLSSVPSTSLSSVPPGALASTLAHRAAVTNCTKAINTPFRTWPLNSTEWLAIGAPL